MSDRKKTNKKGSDRTAAGSEKRGSEPRLLSGGNPQIPKGEGDGPVQDYISAMPVWKGMSVSTSTA
jgi:hypothetical protein